MKYEHLHQETLEVKTPLGVYDITIWRVDHSKYPDVAAAMAQMGSTLRGIILIAQDTQNYSDEHGGCWDLIPTSWGFNLVIPVEIKERLERELCSRVLNRSLIQHDLAEPVVPMEDIPVDTKTVN